MPNYGTNGKYWLSYKNGTASVDVDIIFFSDSWQ